MHTKPLKMRRKSSSTNKSKIKILIISVFVFIGLVIIYNQYVSKNEAVNKKTNSGTDLIQAVAILPTSEPSQSANWKTYTDDKLGIELMYPDYFSAPVQSEDLVNWGDSKDGFAYAIQSFSGGDFKEYLKREADPNIMSFVEYLTVNGHPAAEYDNYNNKIVYIAYNNHVLQFGFYGKENNRYKQILSTLKGIK